MNVEQALAIILSARKNRVVDLAFRKSDQKFRRASIVAARVIEEGFRRGNVRFLEVLKDGVQWRELNPRRLVLVNEVPILH